MNLTANASLCLPHLTPSCRYQRGPSSEAALLYTLLGSVSLITVLLNLLVIVSISHFRQLRTPTNTVLVSLAVADLLVGLLAMPIEGLRYIETCWLLGTVMCSLAPYFTYCLLSVSVGNMVLISVDRYIAICNPLLYSSQVTLTRAKSLICLCWVSSVIYNGLILMAPTGQVAKYNPCLRQCVVVVAHISNVVDFWVTFTGPCTIMVVLYLRVFAVVIFQARMIRSQTSVASVRSAKVSEWKAATTLGVVVTVFLMCFCPYYYPALIGVEISNTLSYFAFLSWLMLLNSCMNPLIYAMFYPWFRKATVLILTLRILHTDSQATRLL